MRESDTYQAILDEGRVEGVQRTLFRRGVRAWGEPDESARQAVMAITDLERLFRLSDRLGEFKSWQELLQTP